MMRNLLTAGLGLLASLSAIAPVDAFYIPGRQPDSAKSHAHTLRLFSY